MDEIITLIVETAAIWAPSLVSILGVVTTVLVAINKTMEAINNLKNSNSSLKDELQEVKNKLVEQASQNEALLQSYKDITDSLKTIKNYTKSKRGDFND